MNTYEIQTALRQMIESDAPVTDIRNWLSHHANNGGDALRVWTAYTAAFDRHRWLRAFINTRLPE